MQTHNALMDTSRQAAPARSEQQTPCFQPLTNVYETEDAITVVASMPGADPSSIDVRYEHRRLSIHARVKPRQAADVRYLMQEYAPGDFRRSFEISERIDAANIAAEYSDGMLRLRLPKAENAKSRQIPVQVK